MTMPNDGSLQKLYAKGKRVVEHGSYHYQRSPSNFKRIKIDAPSLQGVRVKFPESLKANDDAVIRAKPLRIASEKNIKVLRKDAKPEKVATRDTLHACDGMESASEKVSAKVLHASDEAKSSSQCLPLARHHSLLKIGKGFSVSEEVAQGDHVSSSKSGNGRSSQPERKSLKVEIMPDDQPTKHKTHNCIVSGRKLEKNVPTDSPAKDPNKFRQVIRDETYKEAQTSLKQEMKWNNKDDKLHFSLGAGQNSLHSFLKYKNVNKEGNQAKISTAKTRRDPTRYCSDTSAGAENGMISGSRRPSCSFRPSYLVPAMAKHPGKRVLEPADAHCQDKSKKLALMDLKSNTAFKTEVGGSRVPELNLALDASQAPGSNNLAIVLPDNDHEEVCSRNKVRETLKQFEKLYTKLFEEQKRKAKGLEKGGNRADLKAVKILKKEKKCINSDHTLGNVPGIKIGDQFQFRAELAVVGLHRKLFSGIQYERIGNKIYATSIVDSGRYENMAKSSDVFIYSGEGGNPKVSKKKLEDQKLTRGNLALKNSMDAGVPVRVIHGRKSLKASNTMGINNEKGFTYIYDGLYVVTSYWQKREKFGKLVFKFEMRRMSDHPNLNPILTQQISQEPRESTIQREHGTINNIVQKEEQVPIPVKKAINDGKARHHTHNYMSHGCKCTSGCSDHELCSFPVRSKGEIQFNSDSPVTGAKLDKKQHHKEEQVPTHAVKTITEAKAHHHAPNSVSQGCNCRSGCLDPKHCSFSARTQDGIQFKSDASVAKPKPFASYCPRPPFQRRLSFNLTRH